MGNGSTEIIDMLCKVFLDPFDRITIMSPSYTMYALMGMIREATIEFVQTGDHGYRVDADFLMKRAEDSKMVFLCSPNNPTGMVIEDDQLEGILDVARGLVVLDEAYAEFSGTSAAGLVSDHPNLIVTRSMSKFFSMAGLRIGYCIASPQTVENLEKIRQPFSISSIAEAASVAALNEIPYYEERRERILCQRKILFDRLSRIDGLVPYPSEANFIMVKVDPPVDKLIDSLTSKGILVRDLGGLSGLKGSHIRVTVGTEEENAALVKGLKTVLSS